MVRIKDTFDPKITLVFHAANKNTLGPALANLARANHVSVKVVWGWGVGKQQVESPRPVLVNYTRGSYNFSFFENNTKRESLF